jgi:hypothetical protein
MKKLTEIEKIVAAYIAMLLAVGAIMWFVTR